jgi:glycosyl transferase family 25
MKRIIEYFDRAYIINLADRTDRRRETEHEFQRVGIKIPSEKVRFYTATRPTEKGGFSTAGMRGCFTSHRNVLELASRDLVRNLLVFEDDVGFKHVTSVVEDKLLAQLDQENWDLVFFGYLNDANPEGAGPLVRWSAEVLGTHFYGVNGRLIKTMVKYMCECESRPPGHPDGGPMSPDGAYNHIRHMRPDIRVLLASPNLAYQRSSRTDVHPAPLFDRAVWLRPIMRGARFLKNQYRKR